MEINLPIWDKYDYFFSASTTQQYLEKCYPPKQKNLKSFENTYPFIYYIEHAKTFYQQAAAAPLSVKPILLFYGFTHLMKACLLTIDANYPETTSVLAHGVTTRKRKKQQYDFLLDEVKLQKHGLLPYFTEKIFGLKYMEGNKFAMGELLKEIPEMQNCFNFFYSNKRTYYPLDHRDNGYHLSKDILDNFHMTPSRLQEYLTILLHKDVTVKESEQDLLLCFDKKLITNMNSPVRYHLTNADFVISSQKNSSCFPLPEIMIHYLILYNVSMIARYETEWWYELLKTSPTRDYPFIVQFLKVTQEKGPYLINEWLLKERFLM